MARRFSPLFVVALMWMVGYGCALWSKDDAEPSRLPPARPSPDSVLLEVAFLRTPLDDRSILQTLQRRIDQQHLPPALRKRLAENGIQCGLLGGQLPAQLSELLRQEDDPQNGERKIADLAENGASRQQLRSRTGKRGEIVVAGKSQTRVVLWNENGRMVGETFPQATCLLTIKTRPLNDGRVSLHLTPVIKHGEVKQHFAGRDGRLLMTAGQEEKRFEELKIETVLAAGETLVLTAAQSIDWPVKGLGGQFFQTQSSQGHCRKIVLIRLAASSLDSLFAPEQIRSPIATPLE